MALKALRLNKQLEEKRAELELLLGEAAELEKREAELEKAIEEAETKEDAEIVDAAIEEFDQEREENESRIQSLEGEIASIEGELGDVEERQRVKPVEKREENKMEGETRMLEKNMERRGGNARLFELLPYERRQAIVGQEEVKGFLGELRAMRLEKRAVTGADLTIPTVMLDLIRENINWYSKLIAKVRLRSVPGEARQTVAGTVPEAVWTEMCANINELDLNFNQWLVDGYKVAGFVPICNAVLADSDLNLATEIIEMLGMSIGYALDKAILYGKGSANKMPMGILTRLAQTAKPSDYPVNAPAWEDLHTSNILSIATSLTDVKFFQKFTEDAAAMASTYSAGEIFWAMNAGTKRKLQARAIGFNAAAAIVSGVENTIPVVGGEIIELSFIPDGDIIGGYGELYLLTERAGLAIDRSEHVQFLQDNTVFRGKARYDGLPTVADAFMATNIDGGTVTTTMTFAPDTANAETEG